MVYTGEEFLEMVLTFCIILMFFMQFVHPKLPPKVDLGFIIDSDMSKRDFDRAKVVIEYLTDYVSISPGTTRVGLYTVGNDVKEIFHFKTHVNRECVLKSIKKLKVDNVKNSNESREVLKEAFNTLQTRSQKVLDPRRIYLFLTNSKYDTDSFKIAMKLSADDVIGLILISKYDNLRNKPNITKKSHDKNVKIFQYNSSKDMQKIIRGLKLGNKKFAKCTAAEEGARKLDECNRHCTCINKTLTNCYRLRKEFTAMTTEERRRYLRAYKTLTMTSPYKEFYERYVFMHYKYFCWGIHTQDLFLPWHRWFISVMEDLLKQIDCRVTLAYWDWSHVSNDPWNRKNLWRSTDDGLGGNGNVYKGYCVQKGIFRESEWETPYWEDPMDIIMSTMDQLRENKTNQRANLKFCLRRSFKGLTPSRTSVRRTLALPSRRFKDFDIQIRHNYHDRIHNIVGGTMCTHYAGDTPEFFLHHAFLDKIWYLWQQQSLAHKYVHFLQRNATKMMACEHTQRELIDSHNLPRCIKVKYSKFPTNKQNKRDIDDTDDMARTSYKYWDPFMTESWFGDFPNCSRSKPERSRAKYLHKILDAP